MNKLIKIINYLILTMMIVKYLELIILLISKNLFKISLHKTILFLLKINELLTQDNYLIFKLLVKNINLIAITIEKFL